MVSKFCQPCGKHGVAHKAPVIVVTSSDSPSDLKTIHDLGVKAYFRKPHDLDEFMKLTDIIKLVLNTARE